MRRLHDILRKLVRLPAYLRVSIAYADADEDVRNRKYASAARRLVRAYEMMPTDEDAPGPVHLLMSFVHHRLGNAAASAEMALAAIRRLHTRSMYANPMERSYLRWVAKNIYEDSTRAMGQPMTIDVGVAYDEIDLSKVRSILTDTYGLPESKSSDPRQVH